MRKQPLALERMSETRINSGMHKFHYLPALCSEFWELQDIRSYECFYQIILLVILLIVASSFAHREKEVTR